MTYKLYPFSKKNFPIIEKYADSIYEAALAAEGNGDLEMYEKLFSEYCSIGALTVGGTHGCNDKYCVWLTGADLSKAKKIVNSYN